jgi:cyclase
MSKKLISCLDIFNGKLAKSVKFVDTQVIGDPIEAAKKYSAEGLNELVMYDISASHEGREIMLDLVREVAKCVSIPFSVGGGIRTLTDCENVIEAGSQKVHINSAAVQNPQLLSEVSSKYGSQRTVLSIDAKKQTNMHEVVINGGRKYTGIDAVWWAEEAVRLGAGEIVVNSIDGDGTREGFDIELTSAITKRVNVPVIASGGGGTLEHIYEAFTDGGATGVLVASVLHYGELTIPQIKEYLSKKGIM